MVVKLDNALGQRILLFNGFDRPFYHFVQEVRLTSSIRCIRN